MIVITMTEVATYRATFTSEQVAEMLGLSKDTTQDCLVALLMHDGAETARLALDPEVYEAKIQEFDGPLLDKMLNNFSHVDDRDWAATLVTEKGL